MEGLRQPYDGVEFPILFEWESPHGLWPLLLYPVSQRRLPGYPLEVSGDMVLRLASLTAALVAARLNPR